MTYEGKVREKKTTLVRCLPRNDILDLTKATLRHNHKQLSTLYYSLCRDAVVHRRTRDFHNVQCSWHWIHSWFRCCTERLDDGKWCLSASQRLSFDLGLKEWYYRMINLANQLSTIEFRGVLCYAHPFIPNSQQNEREVRRYYYYPSSASKHTNK